MSLWKTLTGFISSLISREPTTTFGENLDENALLVEVLEEAQNNLTKNLSDCQSELSSCKILEEKFQENEALETELENAKNKALIVAEELNDREKELGRYKAELEAFSKKIEHEQQLRKNNELTYNLNSEASNKRIQELKALKTQCFEKNTELNSEFEALSNKFQGLNKENQRLNNELAKCRKLKDITKVSADLDNCMRQVTLITSEIKKLRIEKVQLEASLNSCQERLKTKKSELATSKRDLKQCKSENTDVSTKLSECVDMKEKAKTKFDEVLQKIEAERDEALESVKKVRRQMTNEMSRIENRAKKAGLAQCQAIAAREKSDLEKQLAEKDKILEAFKNTMAGVKQSIGEGLLKPQPKSLEESPEESLEEKSSEEFLEETLEIKKRRLEQELEILQKQERESPSLDQMINIGRLKNQLEMLTGGQLFDLI